MTSNSKNSIFNYKNWLLFFSSVLVTLCLVEALLQGVYLISPKSLPVEKQSSEYMKPNPYWKVWHYPNNEITHSLQCFTADYSTNELGMKDSSIDLTKPSIALIGDSYIEGYGVSNEKTISEVMQAQFQHQIEVLNFGTSGGFGNAHAVSLFDNFAQEFDPDITLVFFLSYNDLYDNIAAIDDGMITENLKFSYPIADSATVFNEVSTQLTPKVVNNLPYGLFLPYFIKRGYGNFVSYLQIWLNVKFEFSEIIGLPYYQTEPEIIADGYVILEESLLRYKELDAPNLILINIPAPFQVDKKWKSTFERTHDVELDILKPNKRLEEIANRLDIEYFDPIQPAIDYVDSTKMIYPYFYNECDKHFNELGYKLMAGWLTEMLLDRNYVGISENGEFIINSN